MDIQELAASSPDKAEEVTGMLQDIEAAAAAFNAQATVIKEPPDAQPQSAYDGIAILGSHPATVAEAPFDDPRWLIYACSPHNIEQRSLKRVDEWFEIHMPIQDRTRSYHYLRTLEHLGHRVWMRLPPVPPPMQAARNEQERAQLQQMHAEFELQRANIAWFKEGRIYPEQELKQRFGPFHFTSSIAFMLAKAIVDCERMNIPRIGIWGVMQASETEYTYQRPGIQYFIQRATELGIQVLAPEPSKLFEPPPENF